MFNEITLKRFGPINDLHWPGLGPINLVIGGNGTGKTFLLKALYCVIRTLEAYRRGKEPRSAMEILADKLYWTFQADRIGDLVARGAKNGLSCAVQSDGKAFSFSFGKDTTKQIASLENHVPPSEGNSIFLPAKEVLSVHQIILDSRERDSMFGFDDTYLDLARALRQSGTQGMTIAEFKQARHHLKEMIGGRVAYDEASSQWLFWEGKNRFPIEVAAEGVRKVAVLETLLGNRYLSPRSIVFMDEPESTLHPSAISSLLDIVALLAQRGLQFFLASHSYFVVKKLFLLAQEKGMSIPVLSAAGCQWVREDLKVDMPSNPIIDESIRLYKEEVEMALK